MTPLEVLFAVHNLLASHTAWTKGAYARRADGDEVSYSHPHACAFSLTGAFLRVFHITHAEIIGPYSLVHKLAIGKFSSIPLENFNNAGGTTHTLILDVLDRAIISLGGTPPPPEDDE